MLLNDKDEFVLVMAAPRKSGKSHLVRELFNIGLTDQFDHVIIMCPTIDFNDDYVSFMRDDKYTFISEIKRNEIDELFEMQERCKRVVVGKKRQRDWENDDDDVRQMRCPRTLLLLDDCVDSGVLGFRGSVDRIAERGRHINLSVIICSQRISAISRGVRINSDYFLIFSPYSVSEFEQFIDQFVYKQNRKRTREKMMEIFDTPFNFIIVDNTERCAGKKLKASTADDFVKGKATILDIKMKPPGKKPIKMLTEEDDKEFL